MTAPDCAVPRRRERVRARHRAGIDSVEAEDGGRTLIVTFLGRAPGGIDRHHVRIDGGRRITGIRVDEVELLEAEDPELDDRLRVTVDRPGDRSTYRLSIVDRELDPRYSAAEFSFHPECPSDADCVPPPPTPPASKAPPVIDYTARDYRSIRRALLERMTLTLPRWVERHAPDLPVTLVELLAYVGDQLHYFQDAVATEAYLDTARRRISVRRHVRLVDYRMHDGCNARAFVAVRTDRTVTLPLTGYRFIAVDVTGLDPRDQPDLAPVIAEEDLARLPAGVVVEVFEPLDVREVTWHPAHNRIRFWTWGDAECCLPVGATSATLRDTHERALRLKPGDLLVIEEVRGPRTGAPADADPQHRQAVRIVSVTAGEDELYEQPVVEVTWAVEDALRFPVCLSSRGGPDCAELEDVSVARGNVVLVDHGRSLTWCDGTPEAIDVPPDPVTVPSCDRPDFGCADRAEQGPVLDAIHELLAAAQAGRPLGEDDVVALVPLVGQAALDRAGLSADDPAPVQASALQALVAQISYPPVAHRFTPVLREAPVTQRTPYPAPELVALGQARVLDTIPSRARARVEEIWREVRDRDDDRDDLTREQLAELTLLFGAAAVAGSRLAEHPRTGLRHLRARFDELLAAKLARVALLAARARDGVVLSGVAADEIAQTWGPPYAAGLDPADPAVAGPAASVATQDPRAALPAVRLVAAAGTWLPKRDLLASGPRDRDVVGEVGDDGRLVLRFGASPHGVAAPAGGRLAAYYRVGNGTAGNVGAEAVNHLVVCAGVDAAGVCGVRNPLPATGGTDPEPVAVVRQMAPLALHRNRLRAITATDYAELAGQVPGVHRAAAQLRWTGAATEVHVAIEPSDESLRTAVSQALERYRRIGHEVVVEPAHRVPLDVALHVCVDPGFDRGHVVAALRTALGSGPGGFFDPHALAFGEPVRVSRLVAAAAAVPGVVGAEVTVLRPLFRPDGSAVESGLLRLGALEIAECDNAADQPEHGRLTIDAEGGR